MSKILNDEPNDEGGKVITGVFPVSQETALNGFDCHHGSYLVDHKKTEVRCERCGVLLDAFTVLSEYAKKERTFRHYESARDEARKGLHAAEEELRRVRAKTREASRKDAKQAVADERKRMAEKLGRIVRATNRIILEAEQIKRYVRTVAKEEAAEPVADIP